MSEKFEHYLSKWRLSDPQPLTQTATSHLYKVETAHGMAVLKIFTPIGAEDERGASEALRWYDGDGAVQCWESDAGAMLLEYIDGDDLVALVKSGRDDSATAVIIEVLEKLLRKNQSAPPTGLISLEQRFRSLFRKAEEERGAGADSVFVRGGKVARELLANQGPPCLLHGDLHHANIKHHSRRGWLAIDPKGLIGDRIYVAANALCNPDSLPEVVQSRERLLRHTNAIADGLGFDRARLLSYVFAHACLSACWSIEDGLDPSFSVAMAEIAEACL